MDHEVPALGLTPAPAAVAPAIERLGRNGRRAVLLVTSVSLFMVGLDVTIVNVALPSIAHDLHSSLSGLQWTVDVYSVVMASLMMLFGSAGDRFGRRRTFILGLALFSLGSLSSSLAPSVGLLVAFRALQAVGGAILSPVALSIITNTFIHPKQRARAVGVRGSMFGISLALGPIVGGGLVSSVGWRSIFLLNIPIGLAAILITAIHMPESKAPRSRRFDAVGQLLVISLLGTLTYGIIEGPSEGWGSPVILACFAAAATSLIGLLRFETRREEPLVDVRFFRSIPFSSASAIAVFSFGAFGAFLFLSTLYLQDVRGLSALRAGLAISPLSVMAMIGSIVSGRLVSTRGSRLPLVASGICCVIGCLILVTIAPTTSYLQLLAGYVLFGFGFGLVNAPVSYTAVSSMPRAQAGTASAVTSASRQVGQTLGVAIVGSLAASGAAHSLHAKLALASHPAWWTLTASSALVLLLGLLSTTKRANESARRVAGELNLEALAEHA